jgi:subtilisin family serine protease
MLKTSCKFMFFYAFIVTLLLVIQVTEINAEKGKLPSRTIDTVLLEKLDDNPASTLYDVIVRLGDQVDLHRLDESLEGKPRSVRQRSVVRALKEKAASTQGRIRALLDQLKKSGHVSWYTNLWIINGIGARADSRAIRELSAFRAVDRIYEPPVIPVPEPVNAIGEPPSRAAEWNIERIRAPEAWDLGYTGQGVIVGSFDTGVDADHKDLSERYLEGAHSWYDPYGEHEAPHDSDGHGTHTTGTVLGGDRSDRYIGVTPDASFIAAKAWDDSGYGSGYYFHLIFQWFLDPDGDPDTDDAPHVVSNSWGIASSGCLWDFGQDIMAWRAAGIFPSFASGNEGPGYASSISPGNYVESFGVGAIDSGDRIASFSGRGPSACDESVIKPDVSAPGVSVKSSYPGDTYRTWNGTSMACPHVTGAVALLLSAYPGLSIDEITDALKMGAVDLGSQGPDNDYGWGRLDVMESLTFLENRGTIAGILTDGQTQLPIEGCVELIGTAHACDTGPDGYYSFTVAGDSTYIVRAMKFGYNEAQEEIYLPVKGDVEQDFSLYRKATGILQGTVSDEDESALEGVRIALPDTPLAPVVSDSSGMYMVEEIPEGQSYTVTAEKCGYIRTVESVDIIPDSTVTRDFILPFPAPDDVESGANGWIHEAITYRYLDEWHITATQNHTPGGQYSWRCADEEKNRHSHYDDAGLVTRCYNVESGSKLSFWHIIRAERNLQKPTEAWDGGVVEISDDWGETWTQLFPDGGYPYVITANPASPFEPGTPVFSGGKANYVWEEESFDLTGWEGEIIFRFRFGSDGLVAYEGWWIDDIAVTKGDHDLVIHVIDPPSEISPGETASWELEVTNNENRTETVDFWLIVTGENLPPEHNPELVLLKKTLPVPPFFRGVRTLNIFVPSYVPSGTLTVENVIGIFPGDAYSSDSFEVAVIE